MSSLVSIDTGIFAVHVRRARGCRRWLVRCVLGRCQVVLEVWWIFAHFGFLAVEMRFDQLFDGLFFSCDVGVAKPDEAFFKAVAHRLGRSGKELLFIDDALTNVEGARAAGWLAEQFRTAEGLRVDVARYSAPVLNAG